MTMRDEIKFKLRGYGGTAKIRTQKRELMLCFLFPEKLDMEQVSVILRQLGAEQ